MNVPVGSLVFVGMEVDVGAGVSVAVKVEVGEGVILGVAVEESGMLVMPGVNVGTLGTQSN